MNPRVTLLLVIVLAGLALVVFGLNQGEPASVGPTPIPQPTILTLDSQTVTRVTVEANGKTTTLEKGADGKWLLNGGPADDMRVQSFVSRVSNLRGSSQVENPGTDLAAYGLDTPSARSTVARNDGAQTVLLLGATTPVGTGYYLKLEGSDAVFVVPSQFGDDVKEMAENPPVPLPTPTPRPTLIATPAPLPATPTPEASPPAG
jgi:hypothetical protein